MPTTYIYGDPEDSEEMGEAPTLPEAIEEVSKHKGYPGFINIVKFEEGQEEGTLVGTFDGPTGRWL